MLRCALDRLNRSLCRCVCCGLSTACEVWACFEFIYSQQEQWKQQGFPQAERGALGGKPIPRTLSVEESGRSSATLGTASAEEWLQQAAREGENDGDSPASRLQYQLMQGAVQCTASICRGSSADADQNRAASLQPQSYCISPSLYPGCSAHPLRGFRWLC